MSSTSKMHTLADVDDTVGFMAAARALRMKPYGTPPAHLMNASSDKGSDKSSAPQSRADSPVHLAGGTFSASKDIKDDFAPSGETEFGTFENTAYTQGPGMTREASKAGYNNDFAPSGETEFGNLENKTYAKGRGTKHGTFKAEYDFTSSGEAAFGKTGVKGLGAKHEAPKAEKTSSVTSGFASLNVTNVNTTTRNIGSGAVTPSHSTEEDREHLSTFETWGTPAARGKPASRVRRIIIRGFPAAWCTPAKILSLVHGGTIESIHITSSGTAHILFCEHEACKAFYDKYPNGIDLDKERKITVFVDMGEEVDVISSQLSFNLSVGATRAVRAVGVDMKTTMEQLYNLAGGSGREVEKVVHSWVPGDACNVIFRFCSIEDAVRFRASLIRNVDYEQCNVQYAADPCEVATGYHAD
ncbi:hypothetical protein BO71DRAFT_441269 [Aspergillus ellipticus CBS 707.79]|uniref:Uncharacterized protein n=1 Tax=Aspergillus ellipticus CBS 707.79 TaxID=1448320 RepID=A0A319ESY5_9EURO|nr:hypothetical protein BO71DRAFT_441269 [Aspergillus ellipticus CBS 707.79]